MEGGQVFEVNRAILWLKFAQIFNDRVNDLKASDNLTSKTVRRVINISGNEYYETEREASGGEELDEDTRIKTITLYQLCIGSGYWLQLSERLWEKRPLPFFLDEEEEDGGVEKWQLRSLVLGEAFLDFITRYEKEAADALRDEITSCIAVAAHNLSIGGKQDMPLEIRYLTEEEQSVIKSQYVRLMVWGYFLGSIEEEMDIMPS
jgi:hypothetical protein